MNGDIKLLAKMVTNRIHKVINTIVHSDQMDFIPKESIYSKIRRLNLNISFSTTHYQQICLDILENKTWYQPIPFEVVDSFMVDFFGLVDNAFHECTISKTIWQYIQTSHPRITFYCLTKLHKPGILKGRPIVSGSGNLTEGASRLIDCTLRPHVEALFSYVKDTLSFLQIMDGLTAPPRLHFG